MKKVGLAFGIVFNAAVLSAEMTVVTTDGRTFKLPIDAKEVARIEFSAGGTAGVPVPVRPSPAPVVKPEAKSRFLGLWQRSEGGRVVEYMEIRNNQGTLEAVFGGNPKGPFSTRIVCQEGDGGLIGSGEKRVVRMQFAGNDQINYSSSEPTGGNSWSCVWKRMR